MHHSYVLIRLRAWRMNGHMIPAGHINLQLLRVLVLWSAPQTDADIRALPAVAPTLDLPCSCF